MADSASKTVLELALELGVRAQRLVEAMRDIGLEADGVDAVVDPDIESTLIEQMVDQGALPSDLLKGKGRRALTDEPIADDDLVKEALGASESGFSEARIPKRIQLESSFEEKPSLFQRWFGKKNALAKKLKNQEYSPEEMDAMFAEGDRYAEPSASPFGEQEASLSSAVVDETSPVEESGVEEDLEDFEAEGFANLDAEGMEDVDTDEESVDDSNELTELGVDADLMGELEDIDIDDEDLANAELDELEDMDVTPGLEDEDLTDLDGGFEQDQDDDDLGFDEGDLDIDEEGLGEGGEELPSTEGEDEDEDRIPGAFEKLFNRINLSPTESWALMIGSASIMLIVLGITVYWWMFQSPRAQKSLLDQAYEHMAVAVAEDTWDGRASELSDGALKFERFINVYPDNPAVKDAFVQLCDAYFQLAIGHEAAGRVKESEEAFRRVARHYDQFLRYLDEVAARALANPNAPPSERFPDVQEQILAIRRIAVAQSKLGNYESAAQRLNELIRRFGRSEDAFWAYEQLGEIYLDWADANKEEEDALLRQAIANYEQALLSLESQPERNHQRLARMYSGLGDIQIRLYHNSLRENKKDEANLRLVDAIGYYERAENAVRQAPDLDTETQSGILKHLADLYLIRGKESGERWSRFEEEARHFPEGIVYKQTLLEEAAKQREITEDFLNRANALYDELMTADISQGMREEIYYNKAEALYTLRRYDEALEAGEALIDRYTHLSDEINTKIHYLLGHIGWEIGRLTDDFSVAKQYYRKALDIDPMFPREKGGEISHLAEIRLTNCYYIIDQNYEEALARYADAVGRYPDTGYTYLMLVWYGDALEQYGDKLMDQAKELDARLRNQGTTPEADRLRQRAQQLFENAVLIYNRAIQSRDHSTYVDIHDEIYLMRVMFNRAHSAYKSNDLRQARNYFNEALRAYETNRAAHQHIPPAIERLGDIHFRMGDYDAAIRFYSDYLTEAYPDPNASVSMKLADSYLMSFSGDRAREWYRRIARDHGLGPDRGPGFIALRKIAESHNEESGRLSGEEREIKKRAALEAYAELARNYPYPGNPNLPDDPSSLRHIGNIHYELENYPQSISSYRAFIESMPDYNRLGIMRMRIAKAFLALGQPEEAIMELGNISRESMDNAEQYADALILLGQAHEARAQQYLNENQPLLWEDSLRRAQTVYNRVAVANVPDKTQKALRNRQAIDTVIQSRRELAQTN